METVTLEEMVLSTMEIFQMENSMGQVNGKQTNSYMKVHGNLKPLGPFKSGLKEGSG